MTRPDPTILAETITETRAGRTVALLMALTSTIDLARSPKGELSDRPATGESK